MSRTVDAAVVGGGVVGASIAYFLARAGLTVTLLEKEYLGHGGSGAGMGIVRTHYANAPETRLAAASLPIWANWANQVGQGDPCFQKTGVLWLAGKPDADRLRNNVVMHRAIGAKANAIMPLEASHIEPALDTAHVAVAAWEPDCGCINPLAATFAFAEAAAQRGMELELDAGVVDLTITSGRVVGLRTERDFVSTPVVVNAGGAWAGRVAQMAGVNLPLTVERRQVATFAQPPEMRRQHVTVMDHVNGLTFRPDGITDTLAEIDRPGTGQAADLDSYSRAVDPDFPDKAHRLLATRAPVMARAVYRGGWSGVIDRTPDGKPILGAAGPEGLYLACGLSGHGFNLAPAVGLCLSEVITAGQAKTVDITPFRLSRFAEGQPIRGEWEYEGGGGTADKRRGAR